MRVRRLVDSVSLTPAMVRYVGEHWGSYSLVSVALSMAARKAGQDSSVPEKVGSVTRVDGRVSDFSARAVRIRVKAWRSSMSNMEWREEPWEEERPREE